MASSDQQPAAPAARPRRAERRLRARVAARVEPDETFVAWTRAWVSRDGRLHALFAARNHAFAVLTDRRLVLWSTGFFSRRPRRPDFDARLDELTVVVLGDTPGRKLRVSRSRRHAPIRLEMRGRQGDVSFEAALLAATMPRRAEP